MNRDAESLLAFHAGAGYGLSFVGGVIKKLDFEFVARVIELRNAVDQAIDDVAFVEDRKLYGNLWPFADRRRGAGNIVAITIEIVDEDVTINSISGENGEDQKIRNHHGQVERIGLVDAAESMISQPVQIGSKRTHLQRNKQSRDGMKIHFSAGPRFIR